MIYLQLFLAFLQIGALSFGGGYAAMPLIQAQVIDKYAWLSLSDFSDLVTIAEMTPGPIGINSATYIGYEVLAEAGASEFMSILGSFTATFAVVLPSFIIVLLLAKVYNRWKEHPIFKGVLAGLRPAVLGLIGTAAIGLATPDNFIDWKSFVICIVAFAALYFKKLGPFSIIGLGALVGLVIY